tara:strand:- start:661 stop:972 length:312 start_codon:yes stop_codon:yes gene_type:complete
MKHLIKRVRKFFAPNPEMDVKYLQEKIKRLENDLAMFDYNYYQMHIERGTADTSTLDMLKEQAQFHVVNHIELLSRARVIRLKKRLILFIVFINIMLLISLIF